MVFLEAIEVTVKNLRDAMWRGYRETAPAGNIWNLQKVGELGISREKTPISFSVQGFLSHFFFGAAVLLEILVGFARLVG